MSLFNSVPHCLDVIFGALTKVAFTNDQLSRKTIWKCILCLEMKLQSTNMPMTSGSKGLVP